MELDAVKPLRRDHNILQQTFIGSPDNHRAPLNGLGFRNLRRSKTLITLESDDRTELLRMSKSTTLVKVTCNLCHLYEHPFSDVSVQMLMWS